MTWSKQNCLGLLLYPCALLFYKTIKCIKLLVLKISTYNKSGTILQKNKIIKSWLISDIEYPFIHIYILLSRLKLVSYHTNYKI